MLTEAQREFLDANLEGCNLRPGRRILFGSENARPMIEELRAEGVLRPYDVMRHRPSSGEKINLLGHEIPVVSVLVGSYELTPLGQAALEQSP